MSEKLIILSDMWGAKRGMWITSYLGYLQQYFDITYYDIQELSNLDVAVQTSDNLHRAFVDGGIDVAVAHLLKKEKKPAHYLGFSMGGTIAWKAGLNGLPMKSLYAVSSTRARAEVQKPDCDTRTLFGDKDVCRPALSWYDKVGVKPQLIKDFGHTMYTDEQIIGKVSLDLLQMVTKPREMKKSYVKIA